MRCIMLLPVALIAAGLGFVPTSHLFAEDNAPTADRQVVAKLIRDALIPEAAKAKIAGTSAERHREVIKNPIKDIVTYWRSEVSGTAAFVEPEKKLTVEVPSLVRKKGEATIAVKAQAPMKGDVRGKALTDDGQQLIAVGSPYTCTLTATAGLKVTVSKKVAGVAYKIEVIHWDPTVSDLHFSDALDRVRGPIENLANARLKAESTKLRDAMNSVLKKAYEDGRLTLPE